VFISYIFNGLFVNGGLSCPGGQLLPHRIMTDSRCIKCFNDIIGKFVPNSVIIGFTIIRKVTLLLIIY